MSKALTAKFPAIANTIGWEQKGIKAERGNVFVFEVWKGAK